MRTCNFVLVSLTTLGGITAQESNPAPQQSQTEKPKLDFTFPSIRPLLQQPNAHQNTEPGKLDFTLRPQRSPTPQERLFRPNRKIRPVENPSPCSIPLLEAPIPKDRHFFIRQIRPRMDKL